MDSELAKIAFYFDEVERLSNQDPAARADQRLFDLWASIQQPVPFHLTNGEIRIGDSRFKLGDGVDSRIARFSWDGRHERASIVIEESQRDRVVLLDRRDGAVTFEEVESVEFDDGSVSRGEALEVVYDLIKWFRDSEPGKDVLKLTKKAMLTALEELGDGCPAAVARYLRRCSASQLRMLIRQASEDMAADELSDQLSLPLDGTYAADHAWDDDEPWDEEGTTTNIPARSAWTILNDVKFLALCRRIAADAVRAFVIPFKNAKPIDCADVDVVPFRVEVDSGVPVRDGDRLSIHARGVNRGIGWFHVDLFDGDAIYGRFSFPIEEAGDALERIFARPQRGPEEFLASIMAEVERIVSGDLEPASSGLEAALGMIPVSVHVPPSGESEESDSFDPSQRGAWATAIHSDNPIVLLQGPPGTGKTTVLDRTLRSLCAEGRRVLVTAPSNTAVDNICRRAADLPLLRFGSNENSIDPLVVYRQWVGVDANVIRFKELRERSDGGGVYAGTHVGLAKDELIAADMERNGPFDVVLFDEAGMSRIEEFLACAKLGKRLVLFGDHQQLPPFPLPELVMSQIEERYGAVSRSARGLLEKSALEWLANDRGVPVIMLERSYRCQNPRLLRFSSTLFYDAGVKPSKEAEYFKLPYDQRLKRYPPATLRFYDTGGLDPELRRERLSFSGKKPGLENPVEARVCRCAFLELARRYPLNEISVIAPYRRQVALVRETLKQVWEESPVLRERFDERKWELFVKTRVATVDSFQGGESDAVIISYVRSNPTGGVGFVDAPNRINVAHTRCRRELVVVGDLACLKEKGGDDIFKRMERAFERDGEIIELDAAALEKLERQWKETI